jgi:hypothetical protein
VPTSGNEFDNITVSKLQQYLVELFLADKGRNVGTEKHEL